MTPTDIEGQTRRIGAPIGWNAEVSGPCDTLSVRDIHIDNLGFMQSAWVPTPEEREAIAKGAPVILGIMGWQHPVVHMFVEIDETSAQA